ncbi:hypothetical protein [Alteromonas gilva]|uniref:Alginate export domain-containing protein n=1 Tax=Alteromonas gilva TaxID=2987522 RepID=A0ABT5L870_9ALTE|nr:hypothetical protein [Alteromonas gilva]MDC8832013.1 hypothetical protein [Alteromonas gilva]
MRRFLLTLAITSVTLLYLSQTVAQETQTSGDEWDAWEEFDEFEQSEEVSPFTWAGFAEVAAGQRVQTDPALPGATTLRDLRLQLQADYTLDTSTLAFRGDIYYDGVVDSLEVQIREALWQGNLAFLGQWGAAFDAKIGQQVLTWGKGDYLFLNDMFPKDYQSFFAGRDDEYLKAPGLSARLSGYFDWVSVDLVLTPQFEPDNGITGEYFSFFNPQLAGNIAPAFEVTADNQPDNPEWAARAYHTIGQTEVALYGYHGYNKTPEAVDESGLPRYSRLNVWGASVETPLWQGLAKAEYAYHDAREEADGSNPLVPNSQHRLLLGYEQELVANLTGSVQWYTEQISNYDKLLTTSLWPQFAPQRRRHVITTQLVYRTLRQSLTLNWFNFHSTTDRDGYMRFRASYSPVDQWQLNSGFNWFYGDEAHTFYSQFRDASNVYASFRYFY